MTQVEDQRSENTPSPSQRRMTLVGERREPEPSPLPSLNQTQQPSRPSSTATTISPEFVHRAAWQAGVMGALNVLTAVLAVRLTLLVSVCGSAGLAYLVLSGVPDPLRVAVLGVYCLAVCLPLVWLAARR